jgi:N12 class adenine-specific DNA methylase/SAM-dependent methyltransferase
VAEPTRFWPHGQHQLAPSGQASRIAANLDALRALRAIQAARRPATQEEQEVLARWSGWGAVPQVFDDEREELSAERAELRGLLSDAEYAAARRTTINAHYTDAALVQVIWEAVAVFGFTGGRVLEPGCGSGNFIGFAPRGAQVTGVELDPVTAAIAAALYPDAEIRCESFADTRLPDGHFDLVIGNVPFSAAKLHDRRHNRGGHSMHNYFLIKSLHLTRPGGLAAVLTSRYTLDAEHTAARQEMAALAELVTAVRLPEGAHRRAAGTDAVTDLLVLRRREPGTSPGQPGWTGTVSLSVPGGTARVNQYWRDHPDNVLGTFEVVHGQYSAADLTVRPDGDLSGVAGQLAARLGVTPATVAPLAVPARDYDRFEGTLRDDAGGTFSVLRDGLWQPHPCPDSQAGELRDLLGLRDTVAVLLDAETASTADTPEIGRLRAELNRRYDAYVARYGPLNRTSWRRTGRKDERGNETWAQQPPPQGRFSDDPYSAAVYALEDFDPETGQAAKGVIFRQRVITPRQPAQRADSPADAVAICVDATGEVRLADVARLLGAGSEDEARAALGELVYDEPGTGRLVPAAEYLSGKVRVKLAQAEQAAADDPRYAVNVAALRRALPPDLGPGEIDARLGAAWISPQYVQQGLREILEDPRLTAVKGHGSTWTVTGDKASVLATEVWGTPEKDAINLAACLLEQRPVKVSPAPSELGDPPQLRHQRRLKAAAATVAARAKADELNRRFAEWLWEDPGRTADLVRVYNERFNSLVLRSYDDARPRLPGLASWFRPFPHQLAAVARIVSEPAALLAHEVGAGKTAEMAMGAMELRRLGLAAKPAIVVPNHMLLQFRREFLQLYPQARILACSTKDLARQRRHAFIARIATGSWDAVIMTQSVFERIPMSAEAQQRYIDAQLADYTAWLERAAAAGESKRLIKKMETRKLMREERLKKKLARARDAGISWQQTGIDYLFVDEAHAYKNLDTRSNNPSLDIDGSLRASDLEMKLDYLRSRHGRRVVTFATATPIANSMTEAYVMLRYLRPDLLTDAGIEDFDAWVGTFAETTTDVEVAPEGGLRIKDRFARFRNVPELLLMWRVVADVKTGDDLKLPVPELAGGKPEVVTVEPSPQLRDFMATLAKRADAVRRHTVLPEEDNMLKISSDGRAAALDPRLVGLPPPETGKLDIAAQHIARIWQQHRDDTYTDRDGNLLPVRGSLQIVFCDLGTPGHNARWSAYDYLRGKLTGYGLGPGQVRFMHEAKTDKDKAELFAAARTGKIAVLIGSTQLMGVGTNAQDRAVALHHLDCPWRPADVAQREGRILRQRNQNSQVRVIRYTTMFSFDAYMWQTVTRKARFIAQVTHGKLDDREAEDIGDASALSYSEVTALATGDMRILAKARADADVQRLERLEAAWRRTQHHLKTRIEDAEDTSARLRDKVSQLDAALSRRTDTRGDAFTMRLGGRTFTKRTDAAVSLRDMLRTQVSELRKHAPAESYPTGLGALGGFTVGCSALRGAHGETLVQLGFSGVPLPPVRVTETELDLTPDKPPIGLIARLENRLADLDSERASALDAIAHAEAEAERARAALGAPFPQAAELSRARAESDRLAEELRTPGTTPDAAGVGSQTDGLGERQEPPPGPSVADEHDARTGHDADTDNRALEPGPAAPPRNEMSQADRPETETPQPVQDEPAGLLIEHHAQGTLVRGTSKGDQQLRGMLHEHGFRWSRTLTAWYLPRTWTFSTRDRRVAGLTGTLRQARRSFTLRRQPAVPEPAGSPPEAGQASRESDAATALPRPPSAPGTADPVPDVAGSQRADRHDTGATSARPIQPRLPGVRDGTGSTRQPPATQAPAARGTDRDAKLEQEALFVPPAPVSARQQYDLRPSDMLDAQDEPSVRVESGRPAHDADLPAASAPGKRGGTSPPPAHVDAVPASGIPPGAPGPTGRLPRPQRAPALQSGPQLQEMPLTADDICLALARLPVVVIADLIGAMDRGEPPDSVSRQLAPYTGKRAIGEPDAGARETITPVRGGLRIQVSAGKATRAGQISWADAAERLRPGLTQMRRQVVLQAAGTRLRFTMANASFRAVGEAGLAAAAEQELRDMASAAVSAALDAGRGQPSRPADDETAALHRIAELASVLPAQPSRPPTPVSQLKAGGIIGHPGYKLQPFRVSAPLRHYGDKIEITGWLTDPAEGEPGGLITFSVPTTGKPEPLAHVVPVPARSLRSILPRPAKSEDALRSGASPPPEQPEPRSGDTRAARPSRGPDRGPGGIRPARTNGNSDDPGDVNPVTAVTTHLTSAAPGTQEEHMPPDPELSPGRDSPAAPDPALASAGSEHVGASSTGTHTRRAYVPVGQPIDEDPLLTELDRVLTAILERRRTTAVRATAGDDFADIRATFALLRDALWTAAVGSNDADSVRRTVDGAVGPVEPARMPADQDEHATGTSDFDDIRTAFADLRHVLELPGHGKHARGADPHPDVPSAAVAGKLLDQAAAEAQACARWYRDTPEWQRITKIGRATRELIAAIREASGEYWAEIRQDIRVRGFTRTLATRVSRAVSGTASLLASRLERAGHRDTPAWRAAWRLHQATATYADRIMRHALAPTEHPDRMNDVRRIIDELGRRPPKTSEPSVSSPLPASRQPADPPSAVALATTSFPARISQEMTRAPAAPAGRHSSHVGDRRGAHCQPVRRAI